MSDDYKRVASLIIGGIVFLPDFDPAEHKINLEKVLLAIKEKHKNMIGFFVNQYGLFYEMEDELSIGYSVMPVLKYKDMGWVLGDDLKNQSSLTLQYLLDVLK